MSDQAAGASPAPAGDGAESPQEHAGGGNPFASVLDAVPQGREAVEAALKEHEGKITQRFQEAADFRKQWEPFAELGLHEQPVEAVQQAMAFGQLLSDPSKASEIVANPEAFAEVWESIGEALGFFDDEQPGTVKGDEPPADDEAPAWAKELIDKVSSFEQDIQQRDERETAAQAEARVTAEMDALAEEHKLDDEQRTAVLQLAHGYAVAGHEDAIAKGFADFQKIRGAAERGVIDDKGDQPSVAVTPGNADTSPVKPAGWRDAKEIADRRLAAAP